MTKAELGKGGDFQAMKNARNVGKECLDSFFGSRNAYLIFPIS